MASKTSTFTVCAQCDKVEVIVFYCMDCESELCETCKAAHLRFTAMSNHQVVSIADRDTKLCPVHPSKKLRYNCVQCQLVICTDCKVTKHDTHEIESIQSGLDKALPEVRSGFKQLTNENNAHLSMKNKLISMVGNSSATAKKILAEAKQERDNVISRAEKDYIQLEKTIENYTTTFKKEDSQIEKSINDCVVKNDGLSRCLNALMTEEKGVTALYAVHNGKLLERARNAISVSKQVRNMEAFKKRVAEKPHFTPSQLDSENIVGSIRFEPASNKKKQATSLIGQMSSNEEEDRGSTMPFRYVNRKLEPFPDQTLVTSSKVTGACFRWCFYANSLWLPCSNEEVIHVYDTDGVLQRTIKCQGFQGPRVLYPFTAQQMLVAANSGLYLIDATEGTALTSLKRGEFWDVHANSEIIIGLRKNNYPSDQVLVFKRRNPPLLIHTFPLGHKAALTTMIHNQHIYVSASKNDGHVSVYTEFGELKHNYIIPSKEGTQRKWPQLCALDSEDNFLLVDPVNHCLHVLDQMGHCSHIQLMSLRNPWDVEITGTTMFVLHNYADEFCIQKLKTC